MLHQNWRRIPLAGVELDPLTEAEVVTFVRRSIERGIGGRIVTPNVDILRLAAADPAIRADLANADLVVADGAPLVWAARLAGTPLPARVAGSDLIWSLSQAVSYDGGSVYVLGGEPGTLTGPARPEGAHRAAIALATAYPGLRIAGHASPRYGFDAHPGELAAVLAEVIEAKPDVVFVGIGFPRQERLINLLRADLPATWFLGCGAAVNFVAGDVRRASPVLQRTGLEWLHRLVTEPRRLAKRYLLHDAPFAARLLAAATVHRGLSQLPFKVRSRSRKAATARGSSASENCSRAPELSSGSDSK
jgi:N-acetylglucosaminyldiphosphoundecaprenol N-acetyl-beta-D-mannosaminyltransferase